MLLLFLLKGLPFQNSLDVLLLDLIQMLMDRAAFLGITILRSHFNHSGGGLHAVLTFIVHGEPIVFWERLLGWGWLIEGFSVV